MDMLRSLWIFLSSIARDGTAPLSGIGSVVLAVVAASGHTPGLPASYFWAAAFICFVFATFRVWLGEHHLADRLRQPATPARALDGGAAPDVAEPTPERVFLGSNSTPEFLVAQVKGHTKLQARKVIEVYLGKWLKVAGTVQDVSDRFSRGVEATVILPSSLWVVLDFDARWTDRVSILIKGSAITVVGQLQAVSEGGVVTLGQCEIVKSSEAFQGQNSPTWQSLADRFGQLENKPVPIWGEWILTIETSQYQWWIRHSSEVAVKMCLELCKEGGKSLLAEPSFILKFPRIAAITDDGDRWCSGVHLIAGIGKKTSDGASSQPGRVVHTEGGVVKDLPKASQVLCQMARNGF